MRPFVSLLIATLCFSFAMAQEEDAVDQTIKLLAYGIGNESKETELTSEQLENRKDQCFPQQFAACEMLLSNDSKLESISAKYDFKEHVVLISHKGKIMVAAPNMIRQLNFTDTKTQLINVSEMGRTYGRKGFYEVLASKGKDKLLCYRYIETFLPNFNEAMHVGSKDTTYVDKKQFFIYKNQKGYSLENFKPKTLDQFDESKTLKGYIKKEKLKFKDEEDLKKFAQYYWSL